MSPVISYLANTWLSSVQLSSHNQQAGGRPLAQPFQSHSENDRPCSPSTYEIQEDAINCSCVSQSYFILAKSECYKNGYAVCFTDAD